MSAPTLALFPGVPARRRRVRERESPGFHGGEQALSIPPSVEDPSPPPADRRRTGPALLVFFVAACCLSLYVTATLNALVIGDATVEDARADFPRLSSPVAASFPPDTVRTSPLDFSGGGFSFPITRFTPHVQQLVGLVDTAAAQSKCSSYFVLSVAAPFSTPTVDCRSRYPKYSKRARWWCSVLREIFSDRRRVLPGNATFGVSTSDHDDYRTAGRGCFANSGPGGDFSVVNYYEIERMAARTEYPARPWSERSAVPVWRGTPWVTRVWPKKQDNSDYLRRILAHDPRGRFEGVLFSKAHPGLLDARFSSGEFGGAPKPLWRKNATNGLDAVLPFHSIPQHTYYTGYRVAVVFAGIGAAFRTSIHLSTGTAVVMGSYLHEEWFFKLMTPFVNYVPLHHNLSATMLWVKDHPREVHDIARQGQLFYDTYLSFERNKDHLYELLYRLALEVGDTRTKKLDLARGPFQTADSFDPWINDYVLFHAASIQDGRLRDGVRYVVYRCPPQNRYYDSTDCFLNMIKAFYFALITKRAFLIDDASSPAPLADYLNPHFIHWDATFPPTNITKRDTAQTATIDLHGDIAGYYLGSVHRKRSKKLSQLLHDPLLQKLRGDTPWSPVDVSRAFHQAFWALFRFDPAVLTRAAEMATAAGLLPGEAYVGLHSYAGADGAPQHQTKEAEPGRCYRRIRERWPDAFHQAYAVSDDPGRAARMGKRKPTIKFRADPPGGRATADGDAGAVRRGTLDAWAEAAVLAGADCNVFSRSYFSLLTYYVRDESACSIYVHECQAENVEVRVNRYTLDPQELIDEKQGGWLKKDAGMD
mmetsp:Transcript_15782/g.31454  ORF Transcript_15782/g.31454 Transcript_15782/m.31454 type:complete len:818 (-) Transcript_15782:9-2462(-)